jgi:DNA polymerase-3 subunit gamma/tau
MRAFEVITKGEVEIRNAMQPRFHLEMTLLRWIHLRKLVPLSDLIEGMEKGGRNVGVQAPRGTAGPVARPSSPAPAARTTSAGSRPSLPVTPNPPARQAETSAGLPSVEPVPAERLKDAFLEEIRKIKKFFYGTVLAQAQRIDIDGDRIVISFAPQHRALKAQLEGTRPLLETTASQLAGRKITVIAAEGTASAAPQRSGERPQGTEDTEKKAALREQALADSGVQAMLDVFAAEIRDVEEM